jgi:arylsulfatase A
LSVLGNFLPLQTRNAAWCCEPLSGKQSAVEKRTELLKPSSLVRALGCIGAAFGLSAPLAADELVPPTKPNIILVLLDDVSAKEFSCYGGHGIKTPNLDRMAREGVMFRTAWSTPLCGPSRALLHTGRYGGRTQYLENDITPKQPFWTKHLVVGKILQSAGYTTAMVGKSHFSNNPKTNLGFDEYCITRFWPGYDGPPQAISTKGTPSMYAVQWYWHPGLIADGKGVPTKPDDFGPDLEVDRIRKCIIRHKSQPFFVYYPMNLPHMTVRSTNSPTGPGARWNYTDVPERDAHGNKTGKRIKRSLKTDLEYVDFLIGQIWSQVVTAGLDQKTILMVAGDNGTAGYGKGKLASEVALHVPFIVYGPGCVKPVGPSDVLVDFSDILPTLAELAGARLPDNYELDGKSFAPLLQGKPFSGREWIHSYLGTARWLRDQRWLLDGEGKFYDCGHNRDESAGYRDVTASNDPEVVEAKRRFQAVLKTIPAPDRDDPDLGPALKRFEKKKKAGGKGTALDSEDLNRRGRKAGGMDRPLVGAIRWDGWFKDNPWEKNLTTEQWYYRLPFFAMIDNDGGVHVCGDSQSVMDQEIAYAKAGGLSYWAFCYYHPRSSAPVSAYNYGWKRYLASKHKRDLNFCLLLQGGAHLGPTNEWEATVAQFVKLFKEPTYQRVCGDRPLLYVYTCAKLIPHFGSARAASNAFQQLREASQKSGAGNPYIVAQIWPNQVAEGFLDSIRFDALGAYSAQGNTNSAEPFAKLVEMNRWIWDRYKATGRDVVPLVNTGWDGRPRNYPGVWYEPGTPTEIAKAVKAALDWGLANFKTSCAQTVLVYAWNEYDEGGWLCPTLKDGGARLVALKKMLDAYPRESLPSE